MEWMAGLLGFLEFLEFLTTPLGLAASLWLSLYFYAVQTPGINVSIAALLPGILAIDLYFLLKNSSNE